MSSEPSPLERGRLSFSVETRVLRELGERLVKQPEVAVVELIKNAYDADAVECVVEYDPSRRIVVTDDGSGMTFDRFTNAWMRIGTSSKEDMAFSGQFGRQVTGEKGIGRFAVRFLGKRLHLVSVADDVGRGVRTRLTATFNWPRFDRNEDLDKVRVPYRLDAVEPSVRTGTELIITKLRSDSTVLDLSSVRTGSMGMLTPLRSLFRQGSGRRAIAREGGRPGFRAQAERWIR